VTDTLNTSTARSAAAVRLSKPSFSKMWPIVFFTVFSLLPRMAAMSALDLPWATQSSVSASLSIETRLDGFEEIRSRRGLHEVIVGAEVHAGTQIGLFAFRGKEDEGRGG